MEKGSSLFEDIRKRLTMEDEVTPKEYLYFLAVAQIPELQYLQKVEGDCLADRKLLSCTKSMQTASQEGYDQALKQFEDFKKKDASTLQEQADKDYENKMFKYNRDKLSISYQEKLFKATRNNIEKFADLKEFHGKVIEFLDQVEDNIKKQKKEVKKPKKETVEEYKERITKAYEKGLEEYSKTLEKEKNYTIAGINEFVNHFVEVLDTCE